jgi:hypothetical protein
VQPTQFDISERVHLQRKYSTAGSPLGT